MSLVQVRSALKKPESDRTEAEAAALLLHRETVEELCKRQIRTSVLKRKQEEVRWSDGRAEFELQPVNSVGFQGNVRLV